MSSDDKKRRLDDETTSSGSGSNLPDKDKVSGAGDKFVLVIDQATGVKKKAQLSSDGTLSLVSLDRGFPGCYGLEYSSSNDVCIVPFNENKKAFEAPSDGWKEKVFQVTYQGKKPGTPYDEVQARSRLSTGSACPVKKFEKDNSNLPTLEAVKDFCFYIQGDGIKDCVICLEADLFCTFRHGTHKEYVFKQPITIYTYNGSNSFETIVRYIDERLDYIILKSNVEMEKVPPLCNDYSIGEPLNVFGRSDEDGTLAYSRGSIRTSRLGYYSDGVHHMGPFLLGDIHTMPGDSGSAVFSTKGLIGMHVRVTPFFQSGTDVLYDAAHFKVVNWIVRIEDLLRGVKTVKAIDSPPRPKDHPQQSFFEYEGNVLTGS